MLVPRAPGPHKERGNREKMEDENLITKILEYVKAKHARPPRQRLLLPEINGYSKATVKRHAEICGARGYLKIHFHKVLSGQFSR